MMQQPESNLRGQVRGEAELWIKSLSGQRLLRPYGLEAVTSPVAGFSTSEAGSPGREAVLVPRSR
jgi:hypothetical protein